MIGAGRLGEAAALMMAIALQNMPGGLAVALPLVREKWPRGKALAYALGSGMAEPIAGSPRRPGRHADEATAAVGAGLRGRRYALRRLDEIIPETHSRGFELEGTWGIIIGFLVMMFSDNVFG